MLITRDEEFGTKQSVQTNLAKLTLTFLVTSLPFTNPNSNLVFSDLHTFTVYVFKTLKASFWYFGSSFYCEGSHVRVKIQ